MPSVSETVSELAKVELLPPDTVVIAGESVRVGGTVYRAVAVLVSAKLARAGGASVEDFCRAVWGGRAVGAGAVRTLCSRAGAMLRALGADVLVRVEGGRVVVR
jgi:hypothetical protein